MSTIKYEVWTLTGSHLAHSGQRESGLKMSSHQKLSRAYESLLRINRIHHGLISLAIFKPGGMEEVEISTYVDHNGEVRAQLLETGAPLMETAAEMMNQDEEVAS